MGALDSVPRPVLVGVALALLFLAAAKAHGRQVRLLRERIGVWKVDFRENNGSAVEAIWRKDRWVFWSALGLAVLASLGLAVFAVGYREWAWLPALAAACFCAAFTVSGVVAWIRLAAPGGEDAWRRKAQLGSIAWWLIVGTMWTALALVV
jgi:hypothetical protein